MLRSRRTLTAAALAISLAATAACGGGDDGGSTGGEGGGEPIELGFISIFSGRVAMLGETGYQGAELAVEHINESGGVLDGREFTISNKDTGANPEQAVRAARDFVLQDEVDFLIDGSSSNESFAVSQASPQFDTVVIATGSEADTLTSKENFQDRVFRAARSTKLDGALNAQYGETLGITNWASISPDYAYGRDCTDRYFEALKERQPDVKVDNQLWPALFEPDYTPLIQQLMQRKPEAVYSCLWGGDLVAFIQQAEPFGFFDQITFVTPALADSLVLEGLGDKLPAGIHTASRFALGSPPTKANEEFSVEYQEKYGEGATNWAVQAYIGVHLLADAIEKAGSTDPDEVAAALEGMEYKDSPWGDVSLRESDHTLINYDVRWGVTDPAREDYPVDFTFETEWAPVLEGAGS
jgi:branched-chain amino acid transport system substrate-binding protein